MVWAGVGVVRRGKRKKKNGPASHPRHFLLFMIIKVGYTKLSDKAAAYR
jgi:hypothetical protein